jgi:hypothetical protein
MVAAASSVSGRESDTNAQASQHSLSLVLARAHADFHLVTPGRHTAIGTCASGTIVVGQDRLKIAELVAQRRDEVEALGADNYGRRTHHGWWSGGRPRQTMQRETEIK